MRQSRYRSFDFMQTAVQILGFPPHKTHILQPLDMSMFWPLKEKVISLAASYGCVKLKWLFNVTIYDISVIYVTAHSCEGGLKKKFDLRSGSQRHRHIVGFFKVLP